MVNYAKLKQQITAVYNDNHNYPAAVATVFSNYITCINHTSKVIEGLHMNIADYSVERIKNLINYIQNNPEQYVDKLLQEYGIFTEDTDICPYI